MPPKPAIMTAFFLQPIAFGSWLPQIPGVQERLALGPAELAIALLGLPTGILLMLPFAGQLVARIGSRNTLIFGFPVFLALVPLPVAAPDIGSLFLLLALLGIGLSTIELALNVEADVIEKRGTVSIMNRCHGFWSLGIMTGSLIGAGFLALDVWSFLAIGLLSLLLAPVALVVCRALPIQAGQADEAEKRSSWSMPSPAILGISLFVFGITMTEGAVADWSAVYLKDIFATSGMATGMGYVVFAMLVSVGRFLGDAAKERLGAVVLARICLSLSLAGMLLVVVAPVTTIVYLGLACVGLGVSVGFPLAVTASADLGDRPAAENVAILSFIALFGFLVGPPMIGFVAELAGLRSGLATLLPPLVLSILLAGLLRRRKAA
ncbi:MFS transporter [Rhizobium rhizophilum]|uniref:MFS transporter n=1 Tax=Rhizobium rhizophilum TaxID=1850373 RepID=A0ABY2QPU6_9HYPH|nr:MFS transporter [Rhizobium rhizophilum]THV10978.1 MFS transporter [Rhizobium rhizophilum]